jgi:serine/threonine protein kinase
MHRRQTGGRRLAFDSHARTPGVELTAEREARAVSSHNHPHIYELYDIGQQDGVDYLVMEYLKGETLAHRLKKGPLPRADRKCFIFPAAST